MNDKIKELKSQALKECVDQSDSINESETLTLREFHAAVEQRFVELIIKECYQVCKGNLVDKTLAKEYELTYNDGVSDCAVGLLQHFELLNNKDIV